MVELASKTATQADVTDFCNRDFCRVSVCEKRSLVLVQQNMLPQTLQCIYDAMLGCGSVGPTLHPSIHERYLIIWRGVNFTLKMVHHWLLDQILEKVHRPTCAIFIVGGDRSAAIIEPGRWPKKKTFNKIRLSIKIGGNGNDHVSSQVWSIN